MAEDFLTPDDPIPPAAPPDRAKIKHLLIGSPKVVQRTIHTLHVQGYAEANFWSKPVAAQSLGEPGEVVSILWRYLTVDQSLQ